MVKLILMMVKGKFQNQNQPWKYPKASHINLADVLKIPSTWLPLNHLAAKIPQVSTHAQGI